MTKQKSFTVCITAQWQIVESLAVEIAEQVERLGYQCVSQSDPTPLDRDQSSVCLVVE